MAKKKRKQPNLPQETLDRAEDQAAGRWMEKPVEAPRPAPLTEKPGKPAASPTRTVATVNLAQEYWYVMEDLRRIGALAALMLAALVGLKIVSG